MGTDRAITGRAVDVYGLPLRQNFAHPLSARLRLNLRATPRAGGRWIGGGPAAPQLAHEPRSGELPVAAHSPRRSFHDFSGVLLAQTSEITELNDLRLPGRHLREGFESIIEHQK